MRDPQNHGLHVCEAVTIVNAPTHTASTYQDSQHVSIANVLGSVCHLDLQDLCYSKTLAVKVEPSESVPL